VAEPEFYEIGDRKVRCVLHGPGEGGDE
jgi:hypothetical protein